MVKKVLLCILGLSLGLSTAARAFDGAEAFQDQLLTIKRSQMGPMLGVDQRTVDQLLLIEQRYRVLKQQNNRDALNAMRQLQQLMQNPRPREEDVRAVMAVLVQKKKEQDTLKQRQLDEEMALLSPVQQARYLLYKMQLVREARNVRSPAAPAPKSPGRGPEGVPVFRPNQ